MYHKYQLGGGVGVVGSPHIPFPYSPNSHFENYHGRSMLQYDHTVFLDHIPPGKGFDRKIGM